MKRFAIATAALILLSAGCKDSRRLPSKSWTATPGPVTVNAVVLDEKAAPRQVALAMLDLLRKCRDVRGQGLADPTRAAEFDETRNLIRRLAAPEAIHELALKDPLRVIPKDVTAEQAVEIFTNSWPSLVARYINGLAPESLVEQLPNSTSARVIVRADSPDDRAVVSDLEKSLAGQRGPSRQPLAPGSEAFNAAVRDAALDRGVVVPIETQIELSLVRESGFWRVSRIQLNRAAAGFAKNPATTTTRASAS